MTYEDAWANLKFFIDPNNTESKDDYIDELELAIKALDKQVAHAPRIYAKKWFCYNCGTCIDYMNDYINKDGNQPSYCIECGQKINTWGSIND